MSTSGRDGRCGTCRYWHRIGETGQCKRMPPTVVAYWGGGRSTGTVWPETDPRDGCGEYAETGGTRQ